MNKAELTQVVTEILYAHYVKNLKVVAKEIVEAVKKLEAYEKQNRK